MEFWKSDRVRLWLRMKQKIQNIEERFVWRSMGDVGEEKDVMFSVLNRVRVKFEREGEVYIAGSGRS